jgi:hypothetical protein
MDGLKFGRHEELAADEARLIREALAIASLGPVFCPRLLAIAKLSESGHQPRIDRASSVSHLTGGRESLNFRRCGERCELVPLPTNPCSAW